MTEPIEGNLYQFSNLAGNLGLQAHQYLLLGEHSVMFSTGIHAQAKWILPEIQEMLKGAPLDYLFISHMEADECGGIALFKKAFPKITVLCSNWVAGELPGFGIKVRTIVCDPSGNFTHAPLDLRFFSFPADVHGKDGLICYDSGSRILYSSDVIVRNSRSKVEDEDWESIVASVDRSRIPDEKRREKLMEELRSIDPVFVATGHGSCIRVAGPNQRRIFL